MTKKNLPHFTTFKKIFLTLGILSCLLASVQSQSKDFGVWYTLGVKYQMTKKIDISVSEELRTIDHASATDQYFTDAGLSYKVNKYFKVGGYYRFIKKNEDDHAFHTRNRFYGELEFQLPVKNFSLNYRFRYQRQLNEYSEYVHNPVIVYNRHKLELEYNIPHSKLTPSISYERFFRIHYVHAYFADNVRYGASLSYKFNKHHQASMDYLVNKDLYPKIKYLNILALGYRFSFK